MKHVQTMLTLDSMRLKEMTPSGHPCPKGNTSIQLFTELRHGPAHALDCINWVFKVDKIPNRQNSEEHGLGYINEPSPQRYNFSPSPHHRRRQRLLQPHLHRGTLAPQPPPDAQIFTCSTASIKASYTILHFSKHEIRPQVPWSACPRAWA